MANSTLAALAAATALTGAELVYGVQAGGDVKITAAQIQTFVLGNSFLQFSGPTTTAKTFALPDASATILTTNAAVTVPQGGTGAATLLAHGILLGNGTSAIAALAVGATGTLLAGATGADPAFSATPTLGANGGTGGAITFKGSTSGSVALQVAAAAGTATVFQLPATNGTSGWVLQTDGAGVTSWVAATGGSPVGSSGQIQYNNSSAFGGTNLWVTDANTIEKYNSTTAQALYSYNTRTDASNYERGAFDFTTTANVLTIGTQKAGTGSARNVQFVIGGTNRLDYSITFNLCWTFGLGNDVRTNQANFISQFSVQTGTQGVYDSANRYFWLSSGANGAQFAADGQVGFSSTNAVSATTDTKFTRAAAGVMKFNGQGALTGVTILALPTGAAGYYAYVTDGDSALAWGATAVNSGSGATKYLVWHNGTNWTVAGK